MRSASPPSLASTPSSSSACAERVNRAASPCANTEHFTVHRSASASSTDAPQRRGIESITTAIRKREASARKVDAAHEEAGLFDIELPAKMADLNDVLALVGQVTNAALEDCEQSPVCDRLPFVGEATVVVENECQRLERRRPGLGHAPRIDSASALPSAWTRNTPSKS